MAVVLFHIIHLANLKVPAEFAFIARDFGKGVHLFFVLSAFSLLHSTEYTMQRQTWVREYFIKRFFRIAPLFYAVLAAMVMWPLVKSHTVNVNIEALLLNLTFTFGLAPWTGIVWAGWTVGVEMLFYLLLPVLLMTVRTRLATLWLMLVCLLLSYATYGVLDAHYARTMEAYRFNWAYFSFPPNVAYFALGMYAYRVAKDAVPGNTTVHQGTMALAVILLGSLLLGGQLRLWHPDTLLWGIGFAALALWQGKWPSGWCANRPLEFLGERSYSLYLMHPIVIMLLKLPLQSLYAGLAPYLGAYAYFACVAVVLATLLLVAEVTYRCIELPAIHYGKTINARLRRKAPVEAAMARVQA